MATPVRPIDQDPTELVMTVARLLADQGHRIDLDIAAMDRAFLGAALLIDALGIRVRVDPDDHTPAAEQIRGMLLERAVATTTRHRRAV